MMFTALLALCCTAAFAAPDPKCIVGKWGEWSDCKSGLCPAESHDYWHMSEDSKADRNGRKAMHELMKLKSKARLDKQICLAKGTCPEFLPYASEGAAACDAGFASSWPCSNIDLLAFIDFVDLGFNDATVEGNDMWVWHDTVEGNDYALMGTTHGTSFVRITDPLAPEVLAVLRTHTTASTWRDMKVVNDHAFIVSEANDHGMQVFDLTPN